MKKVMLFATSLALFAGGTAQAKEAGGKDALSMSSTIVVISPLSTFVLTEQMSSQQRNDLIQVQGDAAIALETGVVSAELASVLDSIRQNFSDVRELSDLELIQSLY